MFPEHLALCATRNYRARPNLTHRPPHMGDNLRLHGGSGEVQLDEVADEPTGQRGDKLVPDCPDLHVIGVTQRPAKAAKADMQREL